MFSCAEVMALEHYTGNKPGNSEIRFISNLQTQKQSSPSLQCCGPNFADFVMTTFTSARNHPTTMFPEQKGILSPLHSFHLATVYIALLVTSNEELPSLGCGLPHRQQILDSKHEQQSIQVKISTAIPSMSQIKK